MFIREALPSFVLYIFSLTMLSAAMSTLSRLFHVTGTSIGYDICGVLRGRNSNSPAFARAGVTLGIVLSLIFAIILPPGVVARGTAIFFGICAAAFLPAYIAALYWKRATRAGVWGGIITGTLVSVIGLLFLHAKEAEMLGVCKAIFGRNVLISAHPWPVVDPFIYALPLSCLALIVVSLLTTPPEKEHIEICFAGKSKKQ
ncbi:MAG: sodium:solute symporter family protein, partial [Lentisphaeria bacterium]|nr:sodium:solute symporter family protein [Lentisphaeria bacterium]